MKKVFPILIFCLLLSFQTCKSEDNPVTSQKRIGAVCSDGSTTTATGSGACSHHGGVDHWLYE